MLGTRPSALLTATATSALVCALVSGCGSGGVGGSGHASTPGADTTTGSEADYQSTAADLGEIRTLLTRQVTAVKHHDEHAFLATVDPQQPALVAQQRTIFENLSRLPIARLGYQVTSLSTSEPADVPGDDPVVIPSVDEHLQLARTFRSAVDNAVDMTFVRRDGQWLLGAETLTKEQHAADAPQDRPWFGGPIAVRQVGSTTVMVDRSQVGRLPALVTSVRRDIRTDASELGIAPAYDVLVDATSNGLAENAFHAGKGEAGAVTFRVNAHADGRPGVAGTVVKVNPHSVALMLGDRVILPHELTHFLLYDFVSTSPSWLTEGVANWAAYYPDDFSRQHIPNPSRTIARAPHVLPDSARFSLSPALNYSVAMAAVTWLVSHGGTARLLDLMKAYRHHYAAINPDALTGQLLRQIYGVTPRQVADGAFALLATVPH